MNARLISSVFACFLTTSVSADVTLDWHRHEEWRIKCSMDKWCRAGQPCSYDETEIQLIYRPQDGTALQNLGHRQRKAIAFKDEGRPGSRARSFLFQLDQGATAVFTLFHSGGAAYSTQYEGSPASGQMRFGSCSVAPVGEEVEL